jgi:4,5-dihydroxyphthalate decarboxylase
MKEVRDVSALYVTLPWLVAEAIETAEFMGDDFWRYGVNENLKEIDTLTRYAFEQGLVDRKVSADELFAKETYELSII